jgi:hypothetical protein
VIVGERRKRGDGRSGSRNGDRGRTRPQGSAADGDVFLVRPGSGRAGEGAGTEVVRHLVPAPRVGTTPGRRIRPVRGGRRRTGRHRAATPTHTGTTNTTHTAAGVDRADGEWLAPLLTELARQLDTGRIYTRDLNTILPVFNEAVQALNRRLQH